MTTALLREVRATPLESADFQIRAAAGGAKTFDGHAAVFDSRTAIGNPASWGWYEEVDRGAFTKTLQEGDARFLVDHDTRLIVARVSAGDLRLSTDNIGLRVEADLDEGLSYVSDLVRNLEAKRITGMSFGFRVLRDEWSEEDVETSDGKTITINVRRLLEVQLWEVSAVTFPAYEETDAGLRAMCAEVRASRTTDSPARRGGDPAPAEATQGSDLAPAEATRGHALRHDLLAARYRG